MPWHLTHSYWNVDDFKVTWPLELLAHEVSKCTLNVLYMSVVDITSIAMGKNI